MAKAAGTFRKAVRPANDKYQVSVYLHTSEAEAVKAISLANNLTVSSVVANLVKESLKQEKYQGVILAYQQFKKATE